MKYQITKAASRDLDHILTYFQHHNLDAGERFVREFNKKCRNLVQFPKLGRPYDSALDCVAYHYRATSSCTNLWMTVLQLFESSAVIKI